MNLKTKILTNCKEKMSKMKNVNTTEYQIQGNIRLKMSLSSCKRTTNKNNNLIS